MPSGLSSQVDPAQKATVVTKSDSTLITSRAIYVGTAGDLAVLMVGDTVAVTLKNVASGTLLPISVQKVMSTNTTADDIVALR